MALSSRLTRCRVFGTLFLAFVALASAHGQTEWTTIPSGSHANLRSVCYGNGQFVAAGSGGTILTSLDGLTWTARASGTTAELTSIAYGNNYYVVLATDGTLLASLDTVTWTPLVNNSGSVVKPSALVTFTYHNTFLVPAELTGGLIFSSPLFRASTTRSTFRQGPWRGAADGLGYTAFVGETGIQVLDASTRQDPFSSSIPSSPYYGIVFAHDAFTAIGRDGTIITSTNATTWVVQPSGTTGTLQGIAAFNNTLVAVGANGTIIAQDASDTWVRRVSPTTQTLNAIAAGPTAAVAVGADGTIVRSTASSTAPTFLTAPASASEPVGGAASFVVRPRGSTPFTYQWSHDGRVLTGETRAELTLTPLRTADAGSYTVTVTNRGGSLTSSPAVLTVLAAPTSIVDATFTADASLSSTPTKLFPLPDGGVLVWTASPNRLVKLTSTGAFDTSWRGDVVATPFLAQPDGRILAINESVNSYGQLRNQLVRLKVDGTSDASFTPPADFDRYLFAIFASALQPDGRILLATGASMPDRLLPDGTRDLSFTPVPLPSFTVNSPSPVRSWFTKAVSTASDGSIFVGLEADVRSAPAPAGAAHRIVHLFADGTRDETFISTYLPGGIFSLRALDDGGVLVVAQDNEDVATSPFRTARFSRTGQPYAGYTPVTLSRSLPTTTYLYSDGRMLVLDGSWGFLSRYNALGALDPTFPYSTESVTVFSVLDDGRMLFGGPFDHYEGVPANRLVRRNSTAQPAPTAPRILAVVPERTSVSAGQTITVRAAVSGSGTLRYDWTGIGDTVIRTDTPVLTVPAPATPNTSLPLQVLVRNNRGVFVSQMVAVTIQPEAPSITQQPTRISAQAGRDVTLQVAVNSGGGSITYEWRRNGILVTSLDPPQPGLATLTLSSITTAQAGTYTLTVRNALGYAVATTPITLTLDDTSRFINLSTRAFVGTGDQVAIYGFVLNGTRSRRLLLRGLGPGLTAFGVTDPLADPQITVFDSAGKALAGLANDDWTSSTNITIANGQAFAQAGAFPLSAAKDAATLVDLPPGAYTAHLTGKDARGGVGLLEIYEADNETERLSNLSTRVAVTPSAPAYVGFAIRGSVPKQVLIRAVGPALSAFQVSSPLPDPRLEVKDASGATVMRNDNWDAGSDRATVQRATLAAGAFPLPDGSRDSVVLLTLAPGNYTAIADSVDTRSGVALVEVYEVP